MDNNNSIKMAKRLKDLRKGKGLTQEALAEKLTNIYGISFSKDAVRNYEITDPKHNLFASNAGMSAERLRCLADFYNVSADWLLDSSETLSADPSIRAVMECTGLTEENVNFLHDPSNTVGDNGSLNFFRKSLYMLINDLIDICRDKGSPLEQFYEIQRILSLFDGKEVPNPNDDFSRQYIEGNIKKSGRVTLSVNESIDYRAEKIAEIIAHGIYEKYSAQERTEPNGTQITIDVNGKEVTFYKE